MSRKTINNPIDAAPIDNFNFDEPTENPSDPGTNRDPVTSISTGFFEGVTSTASSPSFYRQLVNLALPTGYRDTIDFVDNLSQKTSRLYNEVSQELAPGIREFRGAVKNSKGRVEEYLPGWLKKIVNKVADVPDADRTVKYDPETDGVNQTLNSVFQQTQYFEVEKQAQDAIAREVNKKQFNSTFQQLDNIATNTSQLAAYNDQINIKFQKKSIELGYRQLFTARDTYKLTKASNLEVISELRAIRKNTGLPDINKMQLSEASSGMMREKLLGKAQDYLSESMGVDAFMDRIFENVGDRVREYTDTFKDALSMATDGLEQSESMADQMADMSEYGGPDSKQMAGKHAGNYAFQKMGDWVGRKLRPKTERSGPISKLGSKLTRWVNTSDGILKDWASEDSDYDSIGGMFTNVLKSFIPIEPNAYAVGNDGIMESSKASYWTKQNERSINEIIPGFLARILQSSEKHRLGTENVPLIGWDHKAQKFATMKNIAGSIFDSVGSKAELDNVAYRANDLLDSIDPNQELSPELRKKLSVELFRRSSTQNRFNPADLADSSSYGKNFDRDERNLISQLLEDQFGLDADGNVADTAEAQARYTQAALSFRNLRGALPRVGNTANMFANTGNLDALRQLGIVQNRRGKDYLNDKVFLKKYEDHIYGNSENKDSILGDYQDGSADINYGPNTPPPMSPTPQPRGPNTDITASLMAALESFKLSNQQQQQNSLQGEDLVFHVDRIVNSVDRASSKSVVEESLVVLNDILSTLGNIGQVLETRSFGSGGDGAPNDNEGNGWLFTGRAKRAGKSAIKFGIDRIRGALSVGNRARKMFTNAIGKVFTGGTDFTKGVVNYFKLHVVKDVYVNGELRITAHGIRQGQYWDIKSRKVIKHLRQITGPVHDLNKQEAVLSQEEFDLGLRDISGKPIAGTIGNFVGGVTAALTTKVATLAGNAFMLPINIGKHVVRFTRENILRPKDIYVPGEDSPRIIGLALARGQYFSSATGKPVRHLNQFDSDVKNKEGKVVLTLEEMAAGVVDERGRPIVTIRRKVTKLLENLAGVGISAAKLAGSAIKNSFKFGGRVMGGLVNVARGIAPNVYFGKGGGGGDGPETVSILKDIYNLLARHFGSPSAFDPSVPGFNPSNLKDSMTGWVNRTKARASNLTMPTMPDIQTPDLTNVKSTMGSWLDQAKARGAGWKDRVTDLWSNRKDVPINSADLVKQTAQLSTAVMTGLTKIATELKAKSKADSDGDGNLSYAEKITQRDGTHREGSWQDIAADRLAAKNKPTVSNDTKDKPEKKDGIFGKILGVLVGIGTWIKGVFGRVGDLVKGFTTLRTAIAAASAGSAAADALGGLGDVDLPDGPDGDKSKGKKPKGRMGRLWNATKRHSKTIGRGALNVGRVGLTVGGIGLSAAGSVLGSIGAGIAAFVSSPVVLTVGAVALAGYGAYRLYKTFTDIPLLVRIRMAQYGIPLNETSTISTIQAMEESALQLTTVKAGSANISDKMDYVKWIQEFGLDPNNDAHVKQWSEWFQRRFKPVFLNNVALLASMAPGVKLTDVDSGLPPEQRGNWAKASKLNDTSVFYVTSSPSVDFELVTGTDAIDAAIADAVDKYKDYQPSPFAEIGKSVVGSAIIQASNANVAKSNLVSTSLNAGKDFVTPGNLTGVGLLTAKSNLPNDLTHGRNRTIDSLTGLRMRTYGLRNLDTSKVMSLLRLEDDIALSVSMRGDTAIYTGDSTDLYNKVAGVFGGSNTDREHRTQWLFWFNYRFIPTYLNFYAAVKRQDRSADPKTAHNLFKRSALLNVGKAIAASQTTVGGKTVSVWSIDASPFIDYPLNTDAGSIKLYLQIMEQDADKETFTEPTPIAKLNAAIADKKEGRTTLGMVQRPGFVDDGLTKNIRKPVLPSGNSADKFMSSQPLMSMSAPGTGAYKDIPDVKGSGNWGAVKDTILSAAKIVGVDPAVMAMMANIESTFRPSVKAPTSSASGLFQFIASTWKGLMSKFAGKYGIPPNTPATDPKAASLLAGEYIKQNQEFLQRRLGRGVNATDIYAAHFMGPAGSAKLLTASPTDVGSQLFPAAAKANRNIFFNKDGSPRTVGEVYKVLDDKVSNNVVSPTQMSNSPSPALSTAGAAIVDSAPTEPTAATEPVTVKPGSLNASIMAANTPSVKAPTPSITPTTKPTPVATAPVPAVAVSPASVYVKPRATPAVDIQRQTQQTEYAKATLDRSDESLIVEKEQLVVQQNMSKTLSMIYALMETTVKSKPTASNNTPTAKPIQMPINLASNIR